MNFLDKLPKIPFLTKENSAPENFFALNIDLDRVTASVWTIDGNRVQVLNSAFAAYQNGDDFKGEESLNSLLDAANFALDQALADITPEPAKLLFGVPDAWLNEENLKTEYLKILKDMVKELGVEPMAYVSTTHAIAHLLQKQQGVPLSAVLVQVSDPLVVTVVKAGKTLGFQTRARGTKVADDIEKALAQFTDIEVLPSKFLLFGDDHLSKIKDELSSHSWMDQLPFLHLPKVEILPEGVSLEAIVFAGAFELSPQVIPEVGGLLKAAPVAELSHRLPMEDEEIIPKRAGFAEGDIKQRQDDFVDMDPESEEFLEQEEWVDPEQTRMPMRHEAQAQGGSMMDKIQNLLLAPLALITRGQSELARSSKDGPMGILTNKMIMGPILVLLLLIILFVFVPKAQVSVFVDMKPLENSTQIIADPSITEADPSTNRIPGKIVETDVTGSGDGNATGKKQIGDPAKGKVVVYNATAQGVNLAKGTVLTTDSGLKFVLDNSVQVASKSASAADPPTRSEVADSTASDIGPDGNIPAGTDLKVGSFGKADVVAKVDTAFSGGVSKDVTVVTADDQQRLLAQVATQLKQKASTDLQTSLSGDMKVLPESFTEKINKRAYSKAVGDQADKFSLSLTAHYKGTAYSDADLKALVSKLVETKVPDPEHYTLDLSQTETQAEVAKVDPNGKLYFNAKFKAKLMPKFDINGLKGKIAGKSVDQALQILKDSEAQIIGANVKLSPPLPGPLQRLPIRKENINIEVTAK